MFSSISSKPRLVTPLLLLVLAGISNAIYADTVIDVESQGKPARLMSDGQRVRMDLPGESSYILADYSSKNVLMVSPDMRQIINMGAGADGSAASLAPRVALQPRGEGPVIAGFATSMYSVQAEGRNCGVVYGSQQAMLAPGMDELFAALKVMVERQRNAMGSFAAFMNVCTLASMDFAAYADVIGVPMRMVDPSGKLLSDVKNIDTGADVPVEQFQLPADYRMVAVNGGVADAGESYSAALRDNVQPYPQDRQAPGYSRPPAPARDYMYHR